jgi:hypothetical protein
MRTRIHRVSGTVLTLAVLATCAGAPGRANAAAYAQSKAACTWGSSTRSAWGQTPLLPAAPTGIVEHQRKHWFDFGPPPAVWSIYAAQTKPAPDDYPVFPTVASLPECSRQSGGGHDCIARSTSQVSYFQRTGGYVMRFRTTSFADADDWPWWLNCSADCETRIVDPYEFSRPDPNDDWVIDGRLAFGGLLDLTAADTDPAGSNWFSYALALDGGDSIALLDLSVNAGPDGVGAVSISTAPGLTLSRAGEPITASELTSELESYFGPDGYWDAPGDFGPDLDGGFYFDMMYGIPSSIEAATLGLVTGSWSRDTHVPEPASLMLLALGGLSRRRRV